MFLVRFENAKGRQSVYCRHIQAENGMIALTTARDVLYYTPIGFVRVETFSKADW